MDTAISSRLKEAVRSHFGRQVDHMEPLGGGFSGTQIFRFSIESEQLVARAWPCSDESRTKIDNWDQVACYLEQRAVDLIPWFAASPIPCPVPWNASKVERSLTWQLDYHVWTLTRWVPGETLKSECVTYELLLSYVKQLAVLHRVTRTMQHKRSLSKGLLERRNHLITMQSDLSDIGYLCSQHPLKNELAPFLIKCHDRHRAWSQTIDRLANRLCDSHWILRDLWRDNLLVDSNNRWIHSVDVGASRIDWPAFDFVRLVGSLLEPNQFDRGLEPWEYLLDAYNATNPYSDLPPAHDLKTIHEVSTAIAILFWSKKWSEPNIAPEIAESRTKRMKELLQVFLAS